LKRARGIPVLALAALVISGCSGMRAMTAPSGDLADYRAFRVAAAEGTRLARAQRYLERHPDGAFAAEVRAAFEREEPRYFARAQRSRDDAAQYLADLPRGPHAEAAAALLRALESDMRDAELRDVAEKVRRDEARLDSAAAQRRAVGETILGAVGVLLDEETYGRPRASANPSLRALLLGPAPPTWGPMPEAREQDLFFLLPTRPVRESRLLTLEIAVEEREGAITRGRISGADLFVRWTEADRILPLDPSAPEDRHEAHAHVMERLGGALERRFPEGECADRREGLELYHRACDGWEVVVASGDAAGDLDAITVSGPPDPPAQERGRRAAEPR
jgi:hypothetical protein